MKNMYRSKVLLVNKTSRHIYATEDGETFVNLTTDISGKVTREQAKNSFVLPLQLNSMHERNPNIIKLINSLNLELEKSNETENLS